MSTFHIYILDKAVAERIAASEVIALYARPTCGQSQRSSCNGMSPNAKAPATARLM